MRALLGRLILATLTVFVVLAGVMPERGHAAAICPSLAPNSVLIGDASNGTCTVDAAAPLNGFRISSRLDRSTDPAVYAYHYLNGQLISDPIACTGAGCLGSGLRMVQFAGRLGGACCLSIIGIRIARRSP